MKIVSESLTIRDPKQGLGVAVSRFEEKYEIPEKVKRQIKLVPHANSAYHPGVFVKQYPTGFKVYYILRHMYNHPLSYNEIIKMAFELSYGENNKFATANRGYWSWAFSEYDNYHGNHVVGPFVKYTTKGEDGKYHLNAAGKSHLEKQRSKFE